MKASDDLLPITRKLHILLADDDKDDCLLFKEALDELPVSVQFATVPNGEKLLERLTRKGNKLPDVIFLDLNMPRKNGFTTLGLIKRDHNLENIPVVIFSSADEKEKVKQVYRDAAHYYIRKPAKFSDLKKVIYKALVLIADKNNSLPGSANFVLTDDLKPKANEINPPQKKPRRKIT
ncbi:MAG: response regulator [Saprospiraceae bacterium]|nr:response regulator [Saprospiraceae bacterium]